MRIPLVSLPVCILALLLFLTAPLPTTAHVMGIDLGSEFLKVATTRPSGIEIVLNEQTRRKSNNYVGFRGAERYVGEDAKNFAPRFPNNMITMLNRLIGLSYDDPTREWYTNEMLLTYNLDKNDVRGSINVRLQNNPNTTYDPETLLAMIFSYMKEITKDYSGGQIVSDAVVVVPHFSNLRQRQALVTAGKLGGVNVIGTMHTTTAIALQYGIQNRGFNKSINVLFYDMGTSRLEVGVYTISPAESGAKKADSMGTITTKAIVSDATLGGRSFDACIARIFADEFFEKSKIKVLGVNSDQARKATTVLLRTANKVREILSANKQSPASVEGIAEEKDFHTTITREQFESKCAPLFDRAIAVAKKALEQSGLGISDLHGFELLGGSARMPKIVSDLGSLLGRPVDRTMNGDEAAALGSTFYAARLSGAFSVKGFAVVDPYPENITFVFSQRADAPADAPAPVERPLFSNSVYPSRKSISVNRTQDFSVYIGVGGKRSFSVNLKDIEKALNSVGHNKPDRNPNNTHSIRIEVRLTESGIINITEATLKYHEYFNASRKVKVLVNNTANETEANDTDAGAESVSNDTKNETNATATPKAPEYIYNTVYSVELKKHNVPIAFDILYELPLPMPADTYKAAAAELYAMALVEEEKRATAASKNDLESLIISINTDGLDNLKSGGFLNETEEETIRKVTGEVKEWLEDGEGAADSTTKLDFLNKTATIREAMASATEKQRAHFQAIEDEKRAKIKKAMEEEAAKKADAKKAEKKKKKTASDEKTGAKPSAEEEKAAEEEAKKEEEEAKTGDSAGGDSSTNTDDTQKATEDTTQKTTPEEEDKNIDL